MKRGEKCRPPTVRMSSLPCPVEGSLDEAEGPEKRAQLGHFGWWQGGRQQIEYEETVCAVITG